MISYDGSDREPTKFKAALSADLMMKLVSSVSRYGNIMRPLLWELLNCIFVDYGRVEERFMHDPNSLMLKELVRCPTYLELAHQLHDRLEEVRLLTIIRFLVTSIIDLFFCLDDSRSRNCESWNANEKCGEEIPDTAFSVPTE